MRKLYLPKKISRWTLIKFFSLIVVIFSVYFYFNISKSSSDQNSEVLQAITVKPTSVYRIDQYIMKDVIRPTCDKTQPYMDFFCTVTTTSPTSNVGIFTTKTSYLPTFGVSSGLNLTNMEGYTPGKNTTSQSSGIEYYTNPVLEEINGVPVLAYYGGIYEIVTEQNPQKVVNITRTYKTAGNVGYTAGCKSSWFPSNLGKKGNTLIFGSGGLEDIVENRCYDQEVLSGGFSTGFGTIYRGNVECKQRADALGIVTIPNCKLSTTSSCWDWNYRCKTLNDRTQYYNIPFISVLRFGIKSTPGSDGSKLIFSSVYGMKAVPSSGGAASGDAYSFCRGKTKNDCSEIMVELAYGDKQVLRCSDTLCNDYGTYNPPQYDTPVRDPLKTFWKRVYSRSGWNPLTQDSTDLAFIYGGYDTPRSAYSAARRVDLFQIDAPYYKGGTAFRKYKLEPTLYDGMVANPAPFLLGIDWPNPLIDVRTNALQDFVSDKYFYSLQYQNNTLIFTRFLVTGYCGQWWGIDMRTLSDAQKASVCYSTFDPTYFDSISIPNVTLSYKRNVTFSINSNDDVDIMIAPNYKDSVNDPKAQTRMFRAQKFNSNTGKYSLYELNSSNGGYAFDSPGPGNNTPLTFRYYNNTDSDINNDYAVFVSRNYVFTSKIPPSPPVCTPNFNLAGGGLALINTNPNSMNNGVSPTQNLATNSEIYNLNLSFNSAITLSCPTQIINLPSGTVMNLTLFDGINTSPLATTLAANLLSDRKSINFSYPYATAKFDTYNKYFYQVNFVYDGQTYNFPPLGIDLNRYYTEEGTLNLNTYLDSQSPSPFPDAKLVITKSFNSNQRQYTLSSPSGDYRFKLNSSFVPNFYWDHNLTKTGTTLTDSLNYKICVTNSPDSRITRVGISNVTVNPVTTVSNNYISGSITNGCLDLQYKNNTAASYSLIPQQLDIFVITTTIPDPSTYVNFRVNGNIVLKNSTDIKMYTPSDPDKKFQGVYLASTSVGEKGYTLSNVNKSTNFKIPYYSKLTSALNFSYTEDLTNFINPVNSEVKNTNTYLLTDKKTDLSVDKFDKIDVFKTIKTKAPTVIYVAKNKYLYFDLTDSNILTSLENVFFVSTDSLNTKQRIIFFVDCGSTSYDLICNQNYEYHMKGGIYGDFKLTGKLNAKNIDRAFITITQNPSILMNLQRDLSSNKIFNVTRSKTIFKYLNE